MKFIKVWKQKKLKLPNNIELGIKRGMKFIFNDNISLRTQKLNQIKCFVKEIMNSSLTKQQQYNLFKEKTGTSKRNFQRYKRELLGKGKESYRKYIKDLCLFCQTNNNLIVHHLDKNRKNNLENNLITLCSSCHNKLHKIFKK